MKNQDTIEVTTLKALSDLPGFSGYAEDLIFLHKEIVHFVDLDAFVEYDQTSLFFLSELTELLQKHNLILSSDLSDSSKLSDKLEAIEEIKNLAQDDLIKYLDNIIELAVLHVSFDRYDEKTRNSIGSLMQIKNALSPLITECYPSEEVKLLREQLSQSQTRVKELESKMKRNG